MPSALCRWLKNDVIRHCNAVDPTCEPKYTRTGMSFKEMQETQFHFTVDYACLAEVACNAVYNLFDFVSNSSATADYDRVLYAQTRSSTDLHF